MRFKDEWTFIAVFMLIFVGQSFAFEDGDFQYWNTGSVFWKVSDDWNLKLEQEFRLGDDASNYYYEHTDIGAAYSGLAEWLSLGFNYRGINEKTSNGWKYEHRPHLNVTLKAKYKGAALSNNSRFEFRMRKSAEDKLRYRNKAMIKFPWKWSKWKIQPYLADEIFFDTECVEMTRNRVYAGINAKLLKDLSLEVYYVRENNKTSSNDWNDVNVLGAKLKLAF